MLTYDPDEAWSPAGWLHGQAMELYQDYLDYWELENAPADSEFTAADRDANRALSG